MAGITSVIQVVAWGTRLSLGLYDFAIAHSAATRDANRIAKSVSLFTLMLKQVGTLLKEDNTTPSPEAYETVQDVTLQASHVFAAIEAVIPERPRRDADGCSDDSAAPRKRKWDLVAKDRLKYLLAYVDSLNSTLSVMLQAFYTVRVIAWSRHVADLARTESPVAAADAVANERSQLEVLIIEQQLLLLDVSTAYADYRRTCDFSDSSNGPQTSEQGDASPKQAEVPSPADLDKYRDASIKDARSIKSLTESSALVRSASSCFSAEILSRWTRLDDIERRLSVTDEEQETPKPARQGLGRSTSYPVSLESTNSANSIPNITRSGPEHVMSPKPQRPPNAQIGAMERGALPLPIPIPSSARSSGPFSPGSGSPYASMSPSTTYFPASPAHSIKSAGYSPASPHTGLSQSHPTQASATPENINRPESGGLGIPWRLWLQGNRWDFVDDKVVSTNSQVPLDKAYTDRNGWTEIMQTWVRREALEEARYSFNQVQKEIPDGGIRTRFETCFCIGKPLTYPDIRRLVDRSIEFYRQTTQPPPLSRLSSDSISSTVSSTRRRATATAAAAAHRNHHDRARDDYYSTTPSGSDSDAHPSRSRQSVSRHRSRSMRRRDGGRGGTSTFGSLAKYGGIATLLEGLPEILKNI